MAAVGHRENHIQIRRLSPLINPRDDWLVCVVKAYLDGSASDGVIGLAAYIATETQWAIFERRWEAIMAVKNMPRGVHMKDLYAREREFAGKDPVQAKDAAAAFVKYLSDLDILFRRYSCVVNVADYARAQPMCPQLRDKPLHAFCVDHTAGGVFSIQMRDEHDTSETNVEIWFDGNEAFFKHIYRVWSAEKDEPWSWARYVLSVAEVNNKGNAVIPIQGADVLAWVSRRYRARHDHKDWFDALCGGRRSATSRHDFFDFDALMAKYGAASQ